MRILDIQARGKINLTIDVLYKRSDCYHEVEMIMQSIGLKDIVTLELVAQPGIWLDSNWPQLPQDDTNLAYKAAQLMIQHYQLDAGISINIKKNIPLGAGLAGGSANAAAVILGINQLFMLKRPEEELMSLGKKIGADVPFCMAGKTALSRGIGEKLTPLKPLSGFGILLIKPPYSVSTKKVYNRLDVKNIKTRPGTGEMVEHIKNQNIDKIAAGLCNVLEEVTLKLHPELEDLKSLLIQKGALGSLMAGSGPTIFGLFENMSDAERAANKITCEEYWIYVTEME